MDTIGPAAERQGRRDTATPGFPFRRLFKTRDIEEACAYLQSQEFRLDIPAREVRYTDTVISGVSLPGLYLGTLQYGAASEIRSWRDDYRMLPPIRGRLGAMVGDADVSCGPGRAILTSPSLSKLVQSERGSRWLNIFFRGPALRRHLAGLLGEPLKEPLAFAPILDLESGYGQSLMHYVFSAMADLDQNALLTHPVAMSLFEQFVMIGLLLAHPHNYSEALRRPQPTIAPRDVRRAIDYIEANLEEPIVLADIVAASGIAGRTLMQHFRRYREITPMQYLRKARLDRVREALQRAEPEEGVTAIALRWGFSHMGRFSAMYRQRFGELPSQTLHRPRPH
jgi:AraC-like DNA-binding protein